MTTTDRGNVGLPMKHISLKDIYDQVGKKDSGEDFLAEDYKTRKNLYYELKLRIYWKIDMHRVSKIVSFLCNLV